MSRPAGILAAAGLCLSLGMCATVPTQACLPLKPYSGQEMQRLAAEIEALPPTSTQLPAIVADYEAMRDADRACLAHN